MRHPAEGGGRSGTPIYDALYAEYRRLFRALPGDRTGEEDLRFVAFGFLDDYRDYPYLRYPTPQPALPPVR